MVVLGVAQDGGYPHAGCTKACCARAWNDPLKRRFVVSLAVVDPAAHKWWLVEATPDIKEQLQYFRQLTDSTYSYLPEGIIITHAHIGHYTGLMQLGKEVMGTKGVKVYVLPRMKSFLENNGPWSQLVRMGNIELVQVPITTTGILKRQQKDSCIALSENVMLEMFTVPHREEYSETAGVRLGLGGKDYLFIPDVDKWSKWDKDICEVSENVDVALLDGTFFGANELPGREIKEVPHPFVPESESMFESCWKVRRANARPRIMFIHFNHTNPILWNEVEMKDSIHAGFECAKQGQRL